MRLYSLLFYVQCHSSILEVEHCLEPSSRRLRKRIRNDSVQQLHFSPKHMPLYMYSPSDSTGNSTDSLLKRIQLCCDRQFSMHYEQFLHRWRQQMSVFSLPFTIQSRPAHTMHGVYMLSCCPWSLVLRSLVFKMLWEEPIDCLQSRFHEQSDCASCLQGFVSLRGWVDAPSVWAVLSQPFNIQKPEKAS